MHRHKIAEALLVENGRIAAVGRSEDLLAQAPDAQAVDLAGAAVLPGFIDAHSHVTQLAKTMDLVQLSGCDSLESVVQTLTGALSTVPPGGWLVGHGYDHNAFAGKQHPDKRTLDRVSSTVPVLIAHISGHMGCVNSAALAAMDLTENTPDPPGGKIGRLPGSAEPSGYLEENAFMQLTAGLPAPTAAQQAASMEKAQRLYASYGVTTVQDGLTKQPEYDLLCALARDKKLLLDVVSYVDLKTCRPLLSREPAYVDRYQDHLRFGGYKLFLDGSPQGRTAWLTQPYENAPDGYCGYPIYTDEEVLAFCQTALDDGQQLLAHCNGDAAAQQFLDAYAQALHRDDSVPRDLRPVMIHAQTLRPDQMPALAALGMIPSFFLAHVYHWGETHVENLGLSRARRISPAHSALALGLPYTFHQDTPVLPPDMLETVWCAVNRLTSAGRVLGQEERLSVYDALCGVTCHAAYQYFEENDKGQLRPGMRADLVVVDRDPLAVAPEELRSVKVLATLKDGRAIYRAD